MVKQLPRQQLTLAERSLIDSMKRSGKSTRDALRRVNKDRVKHDVVREVSENAVYRYLKGQTHKLGAKEKRGSAKILTKQNIRSLDQARKRLIKRADNDHRVTYAAIIAEAGLEDVASKRICEEALRGLGVSFKAPRRKVYITQEDAEKRFAVAKVWAKRPTSYWTTNVHALVDNKAFPLPLTPGQRKRLRQTQVTGHLRKASEGVDRGFTKPREKHSFIGIPSVTITGAVAKDKVIMWHVIEGSWNGASAAAMYEDHLKPALVRKWGPRSRYTIVEDGDRKGNTSGKGVAAKRRAKIYPMVLPPRTPSLMPLDYAIWHRIMTELMEKAPEGTEKKEQFLARLRGIAMGLPKSFVKSVIQRMRKNTKALVTSKGFTPKND
jgi:hypothetical protein